MYKGMWKLIVAVIFLIAGITQGVGPFVVGLILATALFFWWYLSVRKAYLAQKDADKDGASSAKQYVFITSTGRVYHFDNHCGGISGAKPILKDKAIKRGYTPCARCCKY